MRLKDLCVPKVQYDALIRERDELKEIMLKQNKMIVALKEEVRQCNKLISLYEACINKGIQIDFPDVTGQEKGEEDISGTDEFNFDDF